MVAKSKWRKILYENQNVPDNYVDETFLYELKKNLYIRNYDYWNVVRESGEVTQQISSVCLFVLVYIFMNEKTLSPEYLVAMATLFTVVGYVFNIYMTKFCLSEEESKRTVLDDMKTAVMFAGFSFGLSPVLVTLTETVSTDTIYAMTTVMLLANLLFHDYGANAAMVSEALSLNAGIFASVCLASRLHTSWHAFAAVTFSLQIFGLFPAFRRKLKAVFPKSQMILTIMLAGISSVGLLTVSLGGAILYTSLHIFITLICPAWLISLQPYKNNIYGPWDEAIIKD